MTDFPSKKLANHPALARIIESGRTNLPTGITTSGALSAYAQNAAAMIRDNRDREKKEIADLNNRLARYVEKVRFLEAQNRVLENDIGLFRSAAHIHSERISVYFEAEKTSLFTLVRENESKVVNAEQSIRKLEPEVLTARKNMESSIEGRKRAREDKKSAFKRLSELEAENAYMKRLYNDCEEEKSHISHEITRIRGEIKKVVALRDKERKNSSRFKTQELIKKLNTSITEHEIAIRDEISKARRDTTDKNRDYFHKELHASMKEIRDQFEIESRKARKTWEEWYKAKILQIKKGSERFTIGQNQSREEILRIRSFVNELRTKISDADTMNQQLVKRLEEMKFREEEELRLFELALTEKENSVIKMREECTKLSVQLDKLCENQINLRREIDHYRKLMENAENVRTSYQSNFVIDTPAPSLRTTSYHSYGSAYSSTVRDTSSERCGYSTDNYDIPYVSVTDNYDTSSNRVTIYDPYHSDQSDATTINGQQFKSFSKSDIRFVEHKDESLVIENSNSNRSRDLSNWKIHHYQDGALVGTYIFPVATHIQPLQKLSIHSLRASILIADHVATLISSFNFSKNTKTVLVDDADEEIGWYAHLTYSH